MTRYIDPRNKVLWHTQRLAEIKAGLKPAPVNVEIDLSNRCSLGCEWCHFAYTHTRGPLAGKREKPPDAVPGGDVMDTVLALDIVDQLAATGVKSVTWTGGGEPTLHPEFNRIVVHTASTGLDQGIYTHGGHINEQRARLMKQHLEWVYVSLDECDADSYKRSKGVDRFEAACDGIRNLVNAEGDATIGVGFLLHEGNRGAIFDMIDLAFGPRMGLEADYVQFRPTILYDQEQPNTPAKAPEWIDEVIPGLQRYDDVPTVLADVERFEMYRDWSGRGYGTCYWTTVQTVITPNGKMWTCVNKREHAGECLGDLSEEDFTTIWQRSGPYSVNSDCRVMCRGHIGNITLDSVMTQPEHENFI